jgi:two-component system, NtrC family, sensor histidine kinase GlrK
MLAGFLLIAVLLSWAALRGWLVLEHYVEQSRQSGEQALQASAAIQELAARTVDLERGARQFAVLKDETLLDRFAESARQAQIAATSLQAMPDATLGALADEWTQTLARLNQGLRAQAPAGTPAAALKRLAELNRQLDDGGRRWIDAQQTAMLGELQRNREQLTRLLAAAVCGSLLVALAMNWWLTRPLERIEESIERLSKSRFDAPISVGGPADLRRLGRRLDGLRVRLGELEDEREQMLRHVSHELKTPLTALREGIALLHDGIVGTLADGQQEVVDILQHQVLTLQRQIEGLLRLNAVAIAARRLHCQPLALPQLLAGVVGARELQIQARRLRVECEAPPLTCVVDGEKLQVVLDNLLSNAIDFSPDGGLIRLHATLDGRTLVIACIDQGPGIAAEDAQRIFAPFVQGSRSPPTPRQGSGVGLSIVRELMSAMGGRVQLVSDKQQSGANLMIALPCDESN